jgi:murein DD-endopeptidase MepM/ murein hydrolase activator NlpD
MPIVAVASGRAKVHTGYNGGYGNYVFIHHAGGYYSLYAHLSAEGLIEDGAWVGRGEKIGECHQSGGQQSCHLHFVLYKDDKEGKRRSVKPQSMDGYDDFSVIGKKYTSSNKGHGPMFNVFDKSVFPAFPVTSVNIAWYPAEVACEKAERLVIDGGCVSIDPKKDCRDAYNDLVKIDRVYLSQYWKGVFFGDGDTSDANLQCIQRRMVQ